MNPQSTAPSVETRVVTRLIELGGRAPNDPYIAR